MKAKRKLKDFDFTKEGSHVALVSVDNGGAANGYKTLITKSVSEDLSENQRESLKQIIKSTEECSDEEAEEILKANLDALKEDGVSPINKTKETPTEETLMTTENVEMIEKSTLEVELKKALEAQEAQLKADYEAKEVELKKSLEAYEAKEIEITKAKFIEKAKGFEDLGISEDKEELMAVALMKMAGSEDYKVVEEVLETAVRLAKNAHMLEQRGSDTPEEVAELSGVMQVLKSKKQSK